MGEMHYKVYQRIAKEGSALATQIADDLAMMSFRASQVVYWSERILASLANGLSHSHLVEKKNAALSRYAESYNAAKKGIEKLRLLA